MESLYPTPNGPMPMNEFVEQTKGRIRKYKAASARLQELQNPELSEAMKILTEQSGQGPTYDE